MGDNENTQVGMMLGTPRYMSPEQANGTRVDGRSDLFAVGVILYELITGKKAFDADSMPTLIMQIVQKDPMPIRQLTKEAPAGLVKIVDDFDVDEGSTWCFSVRVSSSDASARPPRPTTAAPTPSSTGTDPAASHVVPGTT